MKKILLILFISLPLFALSPFSLEGFKEANLKVFDKSKLLSDSMKKKITNEFKTQLEAVGIKTTSKNFSNLLVKIQASKIGKTYIVNASMFIVEDVLPSRNQDIETMAITYKKEDFFETTEFENEVYETLVEFILYDFLEQYKEENDL